MTKLICFSSICTLISTTALTGQDSSILEERPPIRQPQRVAEDSPFQNPIGGSTEKELMDYCNLYKIKVTWPLLREDLFDNADEDFKTFKAVVRRRTHISNLDLKDLEELIKQLQSYYKEFRALIQSDPPVVAEQTPRPRSDSEGSASDLSALSVSFTDSEPDSDDRHLSEGEDDPLVGLPLVGLPRQRLNATMG